MYKHLLFDLDQTLWDFETNCYNTLKILMEIYQLDEFSLEAFFNTYISINNELWDLYHKNLIDKNTLRKNRFQKVFNQLGQNTVPENINEKFLELCPSMGHVYPFVHDTLLILSKKYQLHIVTNGFLDTQYIKIETSNLRHYFNHIFIADEIGLKKPQKEIFEYVLSKIKSPPEETLMIGDDMYADIQGAKNSNIPQVFVNRKGLKHSEDITHEITCISELIKII